MEIFYLGQACFKIKTKDVTVVIDPFDAKFEADIVCLTRKNPVSPGTEGLSGPFVVDGPGEYEVKGVTIFGIPAESGGKNESRESTTIYSLEIEDFYLAHLGNIGQKLNEEQVSELEGVDILMVPVGGAASVDPKRAVEIVEQIAPSIVIPMLYPDLVKLDKFFEEMELEVPETVEKLKLKSRADLPEEREVVLMNS